MRRKRHRVSLRPKLRGQRLRQRAALGTLVILAAGAFVTLRHFGRSLPELAEVKARLSPGLKTIELDGAPEALSAKMKDFLAVRHDSAAERGAALEREFPFLKMVSVRRDWLKGSARFTVKLRQPLAVVMRGGRPGGFFDADGVVFSAPETLYPSFSPTVDLGAAGASHLKDLAAYLQSAGQAGAFSSPLRGMRFLSESEGWEVSLEDGTRLLWGELGYTEEKLSRLREVLADARGRFAGLLTADLRYFEDGKVLLRPMEKGVAGVVR